MSKIVREKYEDGVLVARDIEVSGPGFVDIAKLCSLLVIAVSVAVLAVLSYLDSQGYSGIDEQTGVSDSVCRNPGVTA